jgi:Flp pilus assembly protein TadD
MNLRRHPEAAGHLEMVAAHAPARHLNPQLWAQAHFLLAQCLQRKGGAGEAAQILERLLEEDPGNGLAHYHRGRLAWHTGDPGPAALHLAQALELGLDQPFLDLDPDKTRFLAHYFLGRALERNARETEALRHMREAARLQPSNPAPRTDLARLLGELGRTAEARNELKQALHQNPGDRAARRLLARLEEAA